MSEEPDFDTRVTAAWRQFSGRLCSYFIDMSENDRLTIHTVQKGLSLVVHPYGADAVIEGELLNAVTHEDRIMLTNAGWTSEGPSETALRLSVIGDPDEVVDAVEFMLRELRGVPHPAFLTASINDGAPKSMFDDSWEPISAHTQLVEEVDVMLTSIMSHPPVKDDDGDVPLTFDGRTAFLRVSTSAVIELFTVFSVHPENRSATAQAACYSHQWPDIKFTVGEHHVVAIQRVDCAPLIEEHLGRALGTFLRFFEDEGGKIAAELSTEPPDTGMPPELQTILHLDTADTPLDAEDVALICGQNRDNILGLLDVCGDHHRELSTADRTQELLRSALRFVVLDLPRQR
ncbi:hypothetical protein HQ346_20720 [Rhodococcus sp. BP-252]|uniref:T3SS (YopN, CesT) and YbjN peptide-binding chaperone 1 n=1 Tax=unclassified Rhodococcus (in: high G+C Gram-positive bacteria) TaxID=192944 RepID=UPI001C9A55CB|nr:MULTISPECIES: hypothetical protein [unclassified Rhodococcus (in: high G+C Gram-positive bacteria)]MBY6414122.1 hypothetical protein [Rhodococcus sp. BP-320]MBY6418903.1 hypothetical protein [Rhodococcus sp. BP-321]MBY6423600.1 hypothetical protein [Rhodococcus sp. BP-324]MBY6428937.1 hypothetical protein [Rhodococcus sp. BP-323]MBY6433942.1 hypothetical protein [Rhodococcus sp. BP-322]